MSNAVAARKAWHSVLRASLGLLFAVLPAGLLFSGCGGTLIPGGPTQQQSTTVVLLLTSTANDQLSVFNIGISSVQLLTKSGHSVTLYTYGNQGHQPSEFMHLNGASEPLSVTTVPEGTYSSAVVTTSACAFTTISFGPPSQGQPSSLDTSVYAEGLCGQGTGQTTVNFPSPIAVTGSAEALSLSLQVSQSYTLAGTGANATYTVSPVFTLTPINVSPAPTNEQNGKVSGVDAQITSVDATGLTFQAETINGVPITLVTNGSTIFQGTAGISALAAGELVNVDFAIGLSGNLVATRVEVDDATAPAEFVGPWLAYTANPDVFITEPLNCFLIPGSAACDSVIHFTNTTAFGITGQVTNLPNLPFTPNFSSSTFVLGANFSTFSDGDRDLQGEPYATTVILKPQTINGTITSMSTVNGFSVYTVTLAPYDLIPTLQQNLAPGSPSQVNMPNTVVVYADSNTQILTFASIGQGSLLRFRGVIFDDNGTLRMDCQEILDGVTE
ncbi:MAG: hypothetical protein WBP92_12735 [Candidatus Acidiferrales bacterium]